MHVDREGGRGGERERERETHSPGFYFLLSVVHFWNRLTTVNGKCKVHNKHITTTQPISANDKLNFKYIQLLPAM